MTGRYAQGFDRNALYRFRHGDGPVSSYRLCDCGPYFNVAGLKWRDPIAELRASRVATEPT